MAAVVAAAIAVTIPAADAEAATCRYSAAERTLYLDDQEYGGLSSLLGQTSDGTLYVRGEECSPRGVLPTNLNTDTIEAREVFEAATKLRIEAPPGAYEPGATPEPDGHSEIEFELDLGDDNREDTVVLSLAGSSDLELLGGSSGPNEALDLYADPDNADPDLDIAGLDSLEIELGRTPGRKVIDLSGSAPFDGPLRVGARTELGQGDRFNGGSGDDTVAGGTVDGNLGNDRVEGTNHFGTTVDYSTPPPGATSGVNVDLSVREERSSWVGTATGPEGVDTLVEVTGVVGTPLADRIVGKPSYDFGRLRSDEIEAGAGDDYISGNGGSDQLVGGAGSDEIVGGPDADTVDGGSGNDVITGAQGVDQIQGGSGDDRVDAVDSSYDYVDCGPGQDSVRVDSLDGVKRCESIERVGVRSLAPGDPFSGQPDQTTWVTDQPVNEVVAGPESTFIAGDFDYVGPRTGHFASLDRASGEASPAIPDVDGVVDAVEPDGEGGWFVGGNFDHVDGLLHPGFVHIEADGSIDPELPALGPFARVLALQYDSHSGRVYLGGSGLGLAGDGTLISISTKTNRVDEEFQASADDVEIKALALAPEGDSIYAIRDGGQAFRRLMEFRTTDGSKTGWGPSLSQGANALVVTHESVYVAGGFVSTSFEPITIGGKARNNLAEVRRSDSQVTDWNPGEHIQRLSSIRDIELSADGSSLYAVGDLDYRGSVNRSHAAEFLLDDAQPTDWDPQAKGSVSALEVDETSGEVYLGGDFVWSAADGGESRDYLAVVDSEDGRLLDWNPLASDRIKAIALNGESVAIGGYFSSVNGVKRDHIAEISPDGEATNFAPTLGLDASKEERVSVLEPSADGSTLFVGLGAELGSYGSVRGYGTETGARTFSSQLKVEPSALAAGPDANTVIVGGRRLTLGGQGVENLAALSLDTDETVWQVPVQFGSDYTFSSLEVSPSGELFASGRFTSVAGQPRAGLAKLDPATGELLPWDPESTATGGPLAVAPDGESVYVGFFGSGTIGGAERSYVAELDAETGLATSWNPDLRGGVNEFAALPDGTVAVAGSFQPTPGQNYLGLKAVEPDGHVSSWRPIGGSDGYAAGIAVSPGSGAVVASGSFSAVGGRSHTNLASFELGEGPGTSGSSAFYEVDRDDDTTPPTVSIDSGPKTRTSNSDPTFTFASGSEDIDRYECSLVDVGEETFEPCGGGADGSKTYAGLEDGSYRFVVKAIDAAGNEASVDQEFSIDTTPPQATIDSGPDGLTREPAPGFGFSSPESDAAFLCTIDEDSFSACSGPGGRHEAAGLADGAHRFRLQASDGLNTAELVRTFTVDTTPPLVSIDSGPTARTEETRAEFRFSTDDLDLASVKCRLGEGGSSSGGFSSCEQADLQTYEGLSPGHYRFTVRAFDRAGNSGEQSFSFEVVRPVTVEPPEEGPADDAGSTDEPAGGSADPEGAGAGESQEPSPSGPPTAPALPSGPFSPVVPVGPLAPGPVEIETTITKHPPKVSKRRRARFKLESNVPSSFKCRLDQRHWQSCGQIVKTRQLDRGPHIFRARAVTSEGSRDPSPATFQWRIGRRR